MSNKKKLMRINFKKIASQVLAVLLVLSIVLLSGCDGNNSSSKTEGNNSTVSGTTSSDDNSSSEDANSSQDSSSSEDSVSSDDKTNLNSSVTSKIDPITGEYSYSDTSSNIYNDVVEVLPSGNTAYLSNPIDGYTTKEAEALRKEILNAKNTAENYKITGTTYYVSSKGDDSNSGLSPDKPIKSIENISGLNLQKGDAVLFERGSVFRMYTALLTVSGVTYGSYGTGEKPKFYTSPVNFVNVKWEPSTKKNVWKIDWIYSDAGVMVFDHGKQIGYRRTSLRKLEKNTDFFQDDSTGTMYLYCDKGNPAKSYESIEIGIRMSMFNIPSGVRDVIIDNICFKYGGVFAVNATWNTSGISITNCEIGYIGGCTISSSGRYGNAIQFWTGAKDIVCKNNWIYHTFDTAISWQGYGGIEYSYYDINFSNNLFEYNNCDIEIWAGDGAEVKNFIMEDNIMRFTANGWGTRMDDAGSRGIEGCFVGHFENMVVENVVIKNTLIDCPGRYIVNLGILASDAQTNIKVSGTTFHINPKYRNTNEVIRGFLVLPTDKNPGTAENAAEAEVLRRFDPNAVINWY